MMMRTTMMMMIAIIMKHDGNACGDGHNDVDDHDNNVDETCIECIFRVLPLYARRRIVL